MYSITHSKKFRRDAKKIKSNPAFNLGEFDYLVDKLSKGSALDQKYDNHELKGEFSHYFECHLRPDILLIYKIDGDNKIIYLHRLGSHAELFG